MHAASVAMDAMVAAGVARKLTGRRRNRVIAYDRYLASLSEGSDAP